MNPQIQPKNQNYFFLDGKKIVCPDPKAARLAFEYHQRMNKHAPEYLRCEMDIKWQPF